MILDRLRIQDFRNIAPSVLAFGGGFNVLVGENGQGKTNVLEAIGLLASGRSFRRAPASAMRRHGQAGFYLSADVRSNDLQHRMEFTALGQQQAARINGKAQASASSMGQTLAAVILTPDAPALIRGSPGERRDYLDWVIFCHDRNHVHAVRDYQSALKARNHLLRCQNQDSRQYDAWEERLAVFASHITLKRCGLITQIGARLRPFLELMGLDPDGYLWRLNSALDRMEEDTTGAMERSVVVRYYQTLLQQSRAADLRNGSTSVGPHRDDPLFLIQDRSLARFGSRGQQKRFLLALKLVEAALLRERLGVPPLLLLDDPSAELDREGLSRLVGLLSEGENQIFVATCTTEDWHWSSDRPVQFFSVQDGVVEAAC